MVLAYKYGQMVQSTKDNGQTIKLMAMEYFFILKGINIVVNGKMEKHLAMEYLNKIMEQNMKVIGKRIYKMDKEKKFVCIII